MKPEALRSLVPPTLLRHLETKLANLAEAERQTRIDECLKYLFLASLRSQAGLKSYIPVTQDIDEVWHQCILQTKAYASLCKALPGEIFIHHQSTHDGLDGYMKVQGAEALIEEQLWWLEHYCLYFGGFTELGSRHWNIVTFLEEALSLTLQDINRIGGGGYVEATPAAFSGRAT
jgi:hypothetical protein